MEQYWQVFFIVVGVLIGIIGYLLRTPFARLEHLQNKHEELAAELRPKVYKLEESTKNLQEQNNSDRTLLYRIDKRLDIQIALSARQHRKDHGEPNDE